MPTTFDLSDASAPPPAPMRPGGGTVHKSEWELPEPIANLCRFIVWVSAVASVGILVYLGWGLLAGVYANPNFAHLSHADRLRHDSNIAACTSVLKFSSLAFILSLLVLTFQDGAIGYVFLGISALLFFGIPYLVEEILGFQNLKDSTASTAAVEGIKAVAIFFCVPGVIWTVVDLIRRVLSALENAAIQRANLRYGSNVQKQAKKTQRNVFLGRCWELAYCRDNVRVKCPIFLKKRGPCWWYKQGCMCDDRIVLNAVIDSDWKQKTANAVGGASGAPSGSISLDAGLGSVSAPPQILSKARKIERCQNCVIFNEHQRQKYNAMVSVALAVVPVLLFMNAAALQNFVVAGLNGFERVTHRLSFSSDATGPLLLQNQYSPALEWTIILSVCIVIVSQVLRAIEYYCFKLKF